MRVFLTASALESELSAQAYDNWLKSKGETEDEFIERKRGVDLADLVKIVIEEKLNEKERLTIKGFWFKGKSPKEISKIIDSSVSTVYRLLESAEERIKTCLEYVIIYQEHLIKRELIPICVRESLMLCAEKEMTTKSVGDRVKKLRLNENIPREKLEYSLKMKNGRLEKIETGRALPETEELIKLTAFFSTTADYILFGKRG